jgi:hypothetical protein
MNLEPFYDSASCVVQTANPTTDSDMARYPKIDQPCPLDIEAQKRIQGDCSRCGKTVHCLDDKSDAERVEFMRKASGPVCVSYRLTAGIGAALALSMAGPVMAADQTATGAPAALIADQAGQPQSLNPASSMLQAPQSPVPSNEANSLEPLELIFVGGISKPDEVEWADTDSDLPELPVRREPARD